MKYSKKIPRPLEYLIQVLTDDLDWRHLQGDYQEIYSDVYRSRGRITAFFWVLRQILNTFIVEFESTVVWRLAMLKNYVKIAIRNIRRQKLYSTINILGLVVGLTCSILIFLWVQDERGYDGFHKHAGRIYRVTIMDEEGVSDQGYAVTPIAIAPVIKDEIPEILYAARTSVRFRKLSYREKVLEEKGLLVSPDFLKMFSFRFLDGNPSNALSTIDKIVISEELAHRHFGSEDPMGRILKGQDESEFIVSGVFQDIPRQSHLYFDYLVNFHILEKAGQNLNNWENISYYTYCMLEKGANPKSVAEKITAISNTHMPRIKPTYRLQPLKKLHLDPPLKFDNVDHGSRQSVIALSFIAAAILLIACFNFINLSTARSSRRSLEVGLRKVVGARRSILVRQFLGEAFFITLVASFLAFIWVIMLLPQFSSITGKEFSIRILTEQQFLLSFLGVVVFTGLTSGFYPALLLSSFQPVQILKGKSGMSSKGSKLRKILIVFQFTLTVSVLIGVLVSSNQLRYLQNKDLGYNKTNLMVVRMNQNLARQYETLKQKLLTNPHVLKASATANLPTHLQSGSVVEEWEGKSIEGSLHFKLLWVDSDYLETFDLKLAEGRFFSKERSTKPYGFVLNQTAVNKMGLDSPIGKRAVINETEGNIIGVVKDFHFRSLHHAIEPVALLYEPVTFYTMMIKLDPEAAQTQDTIRDIEKVWKEFAPDEVFVYTFLEDNLNDLYQKEKIQGRLFIYFSGLALFIACLGLLGIVSYTTEQRTKEIGIRKVLGASTNNLITLLLKEFLKWVVISNIVAWPIAYLIMSRWLQKYAYHVSLSAGVFVSASFIALMMALITVIYQLFRASRANPVDSLRYE